MRALIVGCALVLAPALLTSCPDSSSPDDDVLLSCPGTIGNGEVVVLSASPNWENLEGTEVFWGMHFINLELPPAVFVSGRGVRVGPTLTTLTDARPPYEARLRAEALGSVTVSVRACYCADVVYHDAHATCTIEIA